MFFDELSKYKINNYKNYDFYLKNNIFIILTYLILLSLIIYLNKIFINNQNKTITFMIVILVICTFLIIINFRMSTNKYITTKYVDPQILSKELNTGDIVLFRSYYCDNIGEPLFHTLLCLQKTFFTHCGIIYKSSQENILIIESNQNHHYCKLAKKEKNGFQIMNFVERVKNTNEHRIHIYKNNLYKYINMDKFYESIIKYKNYNFNENGIYCLNLITKIFQENNIMKEDNLFPYMIDDIIESKNYLVPIKFEEPILIKEFH